MVKHTQTIRQLLPTNCLSGFDHFVGFTLKRVKDFCLIMYDIKSLVENCISVNLFVFFCVIPCYYYYYYYYYYYFYYYFYCYYFQKATFSLILKIHPGPVLESKGKGFWSFRKMAKKRWKCDHNFIEISHSKLSKNKPENVP